MNDIQSLLFLYSGLLAVNLAFSAALWFKTRRKLFGLLYSTWIGTLVLFITQGATEGHPLIYKVIPAVTAIQAPIGLAELMALVAGLPFARRGHAIRSLALAGVTVALHFLGVGINWAMLPALLGFTLPVFIVSYQIVRRRRSALTFVTKCLVALAVGWALHVLDYAYALNKPEFWFAGYTLSLGQFLALATFATAAVLESIAIENAEIQAAIKYQALVTHSAKMAALGEMAGGIAHEINNPLAVLDMTLYQIREQVASGAELDRAAAEVRLDTTIKTVARIAKIIRGLRLFSRNADGDPIESVPLQAVIDETLAFCANRLGGQRVQVASQLQDPSLTVRCRRVQLSQVLLNLLNNALDATEGQEHRAIRLEAASEGAWTRIVVLDNGRGVRPELRDKVFQPFFTTKEIGKGTGLGLSISKSMIEAQGGELRLEAQGSRAPWTTAFSIRLPQRQPQKHREPTQPELAMPWATR